MTTHTRSVLLATAALVSLTLSGIHRAAADAQTTPPSDSTASAGSAAAPMGPWMMGPGMMGPGMMYNWTPEQRRQHWEQMRQWGYGPGMMHNWTPEQWQKHWEQMHQWGYGPGMMMGPPQGAGSANSGS
jgi:hypothetical protein